MAWHSAEPQQGGTTIHRRGNDPKRRCARPRCAAPASRRPYSINRPGPARAARSCVQGVTARFADICSEAQSAAFAGKRLRFPSAGQICAFCVVSHRSCSTRPQQRRQDFACGLSTFRWQVGAYNRATLAIALWNLEGPRETGFILDWFYTASMGAGLYATPRHQFLRDAEQQENTRPLIAALIRDPRFDTLEWNSLDDLVWVIARWTGQRSAPYPEIQARSEDPAVREEALGEYRRRIRSSISLWLPKDSRHNSSGPEQP
jgi:hypothetical protein